MFYETDMLLKISEFCEDYLGKGDGFHKIKFRYGRKWRASGPSISDKENKWHSFYRIVAGFR